GGDAAMESAAHMVAAQRAALRPAPHSALLWQKYDEKVPLAQHGKAQIATKSIATTNMTPRPPRSTAQ
ncbi:MAG: hypothetical protein RBS27_16400, partial [Giesbergeria sp.]|nr:hypothetical protein [Giesbergeria sp.]